jgi:hypothetical protein
LKHVKDIVAKIVRETLDKTPEEAGDFEYIFDHWKKIAGPGSRPVKFLSGILTIEAENSLVLSELVYRKKELLEGINKKRGPLKIKEIIIRAAKK